MKTTRHLAHSLFLTALFATSTAFAVTPEEDEKKECKKPKFREFHPAHLAEAAPQSEIVFHVSHNADPLTIGAEAKKEKMIVNVQDKNNFFAVTAKLPASVSEGYARIHIFAKAQEGDCLGQDGWLIVVKQPGSSSAAVATQPQTAAENKQ